MECQFPPPLTETALDAALDGEAPPRILNHLRGCPACQTRLAERAAEEAPVRARLFRAECPSSEHLGEWQMGLLEPDQAAAVTLHLAFCPWCQKDVDTIAEVLAQPLASDESPFAGLHRLIARLVQANLIGPRNQLGLALRGHGGNSRAYQADDLQVTVASEPFPGGRLLLVGLLTRSGAALGSFRGTAVQLFQHQQLVAETTVDELDNFTFDGLTPGQYDLALPLQNDVLLIQSLNLPTG
ncbi:MAG: hypothetical protein M5U01_30175 [Ardenticatenaceae bacterium]|nr:hypothetical protein [Ardenticatenaceae bacterium]